MLSFELKEPGPSHDPDELEVYCDLAGLQALVAQLQFLKDGRTEHVHLMANLWGGTHLDDHPQIQGNVPIRSVKIILRSLRRTI